MRCCVAPCRLVLLRLVSRCVVFCCVVLGFVRAVVSFILFARLVLVLAVSRLRWFRVGV